MQTRDESRKHVRLSLYRGLAVLSVPGLPAMTCSLVDISLGGCRCRADLKLAGAQAAESWKQTLSAGHRMEVEATAPPHINHLKLQAEIRHTREQALGFLEVGVEFADLLAAQGDQLSRAINELEKEQGTKAATAPAAAGAQAAEPPAKPRSTRILARAERNDLRGRKLGEILVRMGLLNEAHLAQALAKAGSRRERLGRCLWRDKVVSCADLCQALSLQSGLPVTDLSDVEIPAVLWRRFSYLTMRRHEFFPFAQTKNVLCVAAARPLSAAALTELETKAGCQLAVYLAPEDIIQARVGKLGTDRPKERRHARIKTAIQGTCQFCSPQGEPVTPNAVPCSILDISEGGFRIRCAPPNIGEPEELLRNGLTAKIVINSGTQPLEALCGLRFAQPLAGLKGEPEWQCGLEIVLMPDPDRAVLREMCVRASTLKMRSRLSFAD